MENFRIGIKLKFKCSCGKRIIVDAKETGEGQCPRCKNPLAMTDIQNNPNIQIFCTCGSTLPENQSLCEACQASIFEPQINLKKLGLISLLTSVLFGLIVLSMLFSNQEKKTQKTLAQKKTLPQPQKTEKNSTTTKTKKPPFPLSEEKELPEKKTGSSEKEKLPEKTPIEEAKIKETKIKETAVKEKLPVEKEEIRKNLPPVARIKGINSIFFQTNSFTLDGRESTDPQNRKLSYHWKLIDFPLGSRAILKQDGSQCSFKPDRIGEYQVQLTVHNGEKTNSSQIRLVAKPPKMREFIPVVKKENKEEQPKTIKKIVNKVKQLPIPDASPRVQRILLGLKRSNRVDEVIDFLDQLAKLIQDTDTRIEVSSALLDVIPFLESKKWQVRSAAAHLLGKMERLEAVSPLVQQLKKERGRPVLDIREALGKITFLDFGDDAERWGKFWEANQEHFIRPKRPSRAAGGSFYGVTIQSDRIIFVVDTSGSMASPANYRGESGESSVIDMQSEPMNRLDVAKKELIKQINRFNHRIQFNIIFFDSNIRKLNHSLMSANNSNKRKALKFTKRQDPNGGTNIHGALMEALKDKKADTIILLTDGSPSAGKIIDPNSILTSIAEVNKLRRIKIYTIGIQAPTTASFLESLADQNFGSYAEK